MTHAMFKLLVAGCLFRASASALRGGVGGRLLRPAGWLFCSLALWFAAGAGGAWFPLWPCLLLGAIAGVASLFSERRLPRPLFDFLLLSFQALFSIPRLDPGTAVVLVGGGTLAGAGLDAWIDRSSQRARVTAALLPHAALYLFFLWKPGPASDAIGLLRRAWGEGFLPHLAVAPVPRAERIDLGDGIVGWLERPRGRGPRAGVLLLHGADPAGSAQPAAVVLRRALRHAGCSVLSLDHPGFGESRAPKEEDPIHAWDPLPGERAAVRLLERESPSSRLFAVGHSMGARQVLRILGAAGALRAAALFGCNLRNDSDRDEYWYGRFHSDRRLPYRLSRDRYTDVNRSFYDPDSILGSLDSGHPPVLFAFPGRDFPRNVEPSRASYDALPGPKVRWDIDGSSHYLNSEDALGLVFGDTRVTRAISKRLDRFFAREVDSLTAEGR